MWIHLLTLGLIDGASEVGSQSGAVQLTGSDGYALTYSQYKRLLERLKRRKKLDAEEVEVVAEAYEQLPQEVQERIEYKAAPVLIDAGEKRRIDARMSERKREAVATIVNTYIKYAREREDEEIILAIL